ncbi:hypothetical protein C8R46DRAFT_834015, partial [Mycena filopes]
GTADYTSGEAAARSYCFIPTAYDEEGQPLPVRPPPFRFNPLHDLESTFWIGVWTILYH